MSQVLSDRIATLTKLSGLQVTVYNKKGVNYFVFGPKNRPVKTVANYPKAKLFAEGIAYMRGRNDSSASIS